MDKSIIISDLNFHRRIAGRYQKGKKNPFDFPLMIFFKNTGQMLSQKINLNVLLQFNIRKNITTQHILKSVEGIKKDIPVFMSFDFQDISSLLNRIIYPLLFNSEKSHIKSYDHLQKGEIFSVDISSAGNYPDVSNHVTNSTITKPNAHFRDYIQIINHGLHPGFEPVMLPHVNLLLNGMSIRIKSPLQKFNRIQQFHHIKKYDHLQKEEISSKDISSAGNSVSWDYKFIFHNEPQFILQQVNTLSNGMSIQGDSLTSKKYFEFSKLDAKYHVILQRVNSLLRNSKLANSLNYIQILNHGLHPGFEPVMLPHVNLLLNGMSIQGDSLTSNKYFDFSKMNTKYHVNLPHVNLLLNTIAANNMISYTQEFSNGYASAGTTLQPFALFWSFMQSQIYGSSLISAHGSPIIRTQVDISKKRHGFVSNQYGFNYSFPQADLKDQEFAGANIHFTHVQLSNNQMKNMSYVKSFPASIKYNMEKDYQRTLSCIMPSIIKLVNIDNFQGQDRVYLEPVMKSDTSTENHDLHFKTDRMIEEEIETIKKIAQEAKQTVIENVKNIQTSHDEEMNRKININQLSDRVYRLLDRKITIEKERRGYI